MTKRKHPLSFQQEEIWFSNLISENKTLWNFTTYKYLVGKLNIEVLRKSICHLLINNKIFSTGFVQEKNLICQFPNNNIDINKYFRIFNYKDKNLEDRKDSIIELLKKESAYQFDLSEGILLRVTAIQINDNENILFFVTHHIIVDDQSIQFIWQKIIECYNDLSRDNTCTKSRNLKSYYEFADEQKQKYSENKLKDLKRNDFLYLNNEGNLINLPYDRDVSKEVSFQTDLSTVSINKDLTDKLYKLSLINRVSFSTILISALYILLRKYCNQKSILINNICSMRHLYPDIDIGLLTNWAPVLISKNIITIKQLFSLIFGQLNKTYQFADVPYAIFVKNNNIGNSQIKSQVLFNLINRKKSQRAFNFNGIKEKKVDSLIRSKKSYSKYPLTIYADYFWENKDLSISFEYNKSSFNYNSIKRMINNYCYILEQLTLINNLGELVVNNFNVINDNERNMILNQFINVAENKINAISLFKRLEKKDKEKIIESKFNFKMYILDEEVKLVPIGVYGGIYVSEDSLDIESYDILELKKISFIPNPFIEGGNIYYSGYRGRWLDDGDIEYESKSDSKFTNKSYKVYYRGSNR